MPFEQALLTPFFYILDPTKRIFFIYVLSSFLMALVVLLFQKNSFEKSLSKIFDGRIWNHKSSRLDLSLWVLNIFLKFILFFVIPLTALIFAKSVVRFLYNFFPNFNSFNLNFGMIVGLYSLVSFMLLDFSRFLLHYFSHKSAWLWRFHKIHHTAEVLTPLTLYRTHPVESLLSALLRVCVLGFVSGFFIFIFRLKIDAYAILGVNALDFMFNFLGSNLRHSHVWLSFGPLNHIIISPAQHQIHHSRSLKHRDKNLGFAFAIWDKLFGTFYQVTQKKEFLIFGVRGERSDNLFKTLWPKRFK